MKNVLKVMAVASFIVCTQQTQAQIKFGIKAGLNAANISQNYKESDWEIDTRMRLAYNIGITLDLSVSEVLSVQPGLLLSGKGFSYDLEREWGEDAEGYDRVVFNYLELPINIAYKINNFQVYAGPSLAIGISGKNKWDVTYNGGSDKDAYKIKPVFGEVSEEDLGDADDAYKALDFGLNVGVGYQVGPVLINACYSLGLGNVTPEYEGINADPKDYKVSNRIIALSVSYFFGK